jgi:hypothetical protein
MRASFGRQDLWSAFDAAPRRIGSRKIVIKVDASDVRRLLDPRLNARVGVGVESEYLYAEGYRLGAEHLIERLAETGYDQDFLVYPIVFLYRHYVELCLKDLIGRGRDLADEEAPEPRGHELARLWAQARPHIEREFSGEPDQLNRADQLIGELADTDPSSQTFRYRRDSRGRPHLENQDSLNLGQFAEAMRELSLFLEGCGSGLTEHLAIKRDIEAELRQEIASEWGDAVGPDY